MDSSLPKNLFLAISLPLSLVLATVVMETQCPKEIQLLLQKKGGNHLYERAIWANVWNMLVISPISCFLVLHYGCSRMGPFTLSQQFAKVVGVIMIEGFLLHLIHIVMHEVKGFYWMHKFHHLFNDILLPSTAMAVSPSEFVVAYLLPIAIGCAIVQADGATFVASTFIIAYANIRIHTPYLMNRDKNEQRLAWFMVSPNDHFHHHQGHRRTTSDYSAPLIHFDRIYHAAFGTRKAS